ncbi:hypothetical protein BSKO_04717 [Bryopsis sp. KO-2023]|nr:hypothetical protein BSKO_04717 [Bryopsis sp. KO-2023]
MLAAIKTFPRALCHTQRAPRLRVFKQPRLSLSASSEKMADRVLYWGSGSPPCWKAMVVLEEKNLPYESKMLSFSDGGHKSPEVVAINPRGQFPAFKDGDAIVNESNGIMEYLDAVYPEPALMPADKVAKAKAYQRFHETSVLQDKMRVCIVAKMRTKDEDAFAKGIVDLKEEIPKWEAYLAESEYLAGSEMSLADVCLGTSLLFLQRQGATYDEYPKMKAYVKKLGERPSFQKSWPPHWKDSEGPGFFAGQF